MQVGDPYNDTVRSLFRAPGHAGPCEPVAGRVATGRASAASDGPRVELCADVVDGRLGTCRFRAWRCPHLIAAAELLCRLCENRPLDDAPFPANEVSRRLSVPVHKQGLVLMLEDAYNALLENALEATR